MCSVRKIIDAAPREMRPGDERTEHDQRRVIAIVAETLVPGREMRDRRQTIPVRSPFVRGDLATRPSEIGGSCSEGRYAPATGRPSGPPTVGVSSTCGMEDRFSASAGRPWAGFRANPGTPAPSFILT